MTPMFSIFTLAIKFGCLFLTIFQSFHLFVSCTFDKLAPSPNYMFKNVLNHYLAHSRAYNSLKSAKNVFFLILHFGWHANGGGCSPPPIPFLATLLAVGLY